MLFWGRPVLRGSSRRGFHFSSLDRQLKSDVRVFCRREQEHAEEDEGRIIRLRLPRRVPHRDSVRREDEVGALLFDPERNGLGERERADSAVELAVRFVHQGIPKLDNHLGMMAIDVLPLDRVPGRSVCLLVELYKEVTDASLCNTV
jgi:hypothetical protein